jgi:phage recombination protein Bet
MSSTEVAVTGQRVVGSALVIDPVQNYWTDRQLGVLRQLGVKDATPADLAVFFHQSLRTGLDPFAKQIYMIGRWSKDGTKQTIQTGIDGFRLIARRAADKAGETLGYEDTLWCGPDGAWRDVWLDPDPPAAARVTVLRNGQRFPATVHWSEYVQTSKDKATGQMVPTPMWERMGRNQLAKCAEAQALRKAFPQDLSGLYTDDEMGHQEQHAPIRRPDQRRVTSSEILGTDPPVTEPDPPADEDTPVPMQDGQRKRMFALFTEQGLSDREQQLALIADVTGHEISSRGDLTSEQCAKVIAWLEAGPE